jgi:uncharacterized protein with von Willebrand factor type A (vWA) domain
MNDPKSQMVLLSRCCLRISPAPATQAVTYAHCAVRSRTGGLDDRHLQARAAGRNAGQPASIETTILSWQPGDTIPLDVKRTLQVVRVRDDDADQAPVLVVEDLS